MVEAVVLEQQQQQQQRQEVSLHRIPLLKNTKTLEAFPYQHMCFELLDPCISMAFNFDFLSVCAHPHTCMHTSHTFTHLRASALLPTLLHPHGAHTTVMRMHLRKCPPMQLHPVQTQEIGFSAQTAACTTSSPHKPTDPQGQLPQAHTEDVAAESTPGKPPQLHDRDMGAESALGALDLSFGSSSSAGGSSGAGHARAGGAVQGLAHRSSRAQWARTWRQFLVPLTHDLTGLLYAQRYLPVLQGALASRMEAAGLRPTRAPPPPAHLDQPLPADTQPPSAVPAPSSTERGLQRGQGGEMEVALAEGAASGTAPPEEAQPADTFLLGGSTADDDDQQDVQHLPASMSFLLRPESRGSSVYESVALAMRSASGSGSSLNTVRASLESGHPRSGPRLHVSHRPLSGFLVDACSWCTVIHRALAILRAPPLFTSRNRLARVHPCSAHSGCAAFWVH